MKATELQQYTEEIVVSIAFAWTMIKPEILQTMHALALQSVPATVGIATPAVDTLVTNVDMGMSLRPSEMQKYLVTAVIPTVLAGLQSIAEETLNDHFGDALTLAARLRTLRQNNVIDARRASEAHFWRLVRNVCMHGGGRITQLTENEAQRLLSQGEINFSEFSLWGPLLEAGHGGVPVPIHSSGEDTALRSGHGGKANTNRRRATDRCRSRRRSCCRKRVGSDSCTGNVVRRPTLMRTPLVKGQTTPESGFFQFFSAFSAPASRAIGRVF